MTTHLSKQELLSFQQRRVSAAELLRIDRHLSACSDCAQRLDSAPGLQSTVRRLQTELAGAEGELCSYFGFAQKADYVNGQLSAPEMALAKSHLEQCAECCLEFVELQEVRAGLTPGRAASPVTQTAWEKISGWFEMPVVRWAWRGLGTVATVVVLAWLTATLWPGRETFQPARTRATPTSTPLPPSDETTPASPTPNTASGAKSDETVLPADALLATLRDGERHITLDSTGQLRGLEALSPAAQVAVKEALATQQIKLSAQVVQMRTATVELLDQRRDPVDFALLAPLGQVVQATRPRLRWQALNGATCYYVTVYDTNFQKVAASGALTGTEWVPATPLERGRSYYWQVRALRDEQEFFAPAPNAPDAKFKVLERVQLAEIEQARTGQASHLALGVLYARAGLLEEAGL
ncbi:MAG: zf-HC2 domain-containing protein [Acidobacteria bacterium]|nr:zf-HC2 domain-containing protein [Acidobacteriota bacterium]